MLTLHATSVRSNDETHGVPVTGRYFRRFGIPFVADMDHVSAVFDGETLTVHVPREDHGTVDVQQIAVSRPA